MSMLLYKLNSEKSTNVLSYMGGKLHYQRGMFGVHALKKDLHKP